MFKQYLQIIKPRIIFGNLISVIGGFFLASKGIISYSLLVFTLIGASFVMASSCVLNNYIDRNIDKYMERTKNRVLVKGLISPVISQIYAALLGLVGLILLWFEVNSLTCLLGIIGFVIYVGIYSLYMKVRSIYSTLIGSLSGAMPPVIGYCAVTNKFDICALILLTIFSLWQIPHSYAIAIFHFKDYQIAKIPMLPVVKGISVAKNHIIFYIIMFTISTMMLYLNSYTGFKYLIVAVTVSLLWFTIALSGYKTVNNKVWARKVFVFSLIVINSLSVMMSLDFKIENPQIL